jgi:hypothetical protein
MKLMAKVKSLTNVNNVAAAVIARMRRTHGLDRIDTFRWANVDWQAIGFARGLPVRPFS